MSAKLLQENATFLEPWSNSVTAAANHNYAEMPFHFSPEFLIHVENVPPHKQYDYTELMIVFNFY